MRARPCSSSPEQATRQPGLVPISLPSPFFLPPPRLLLFSLSRPASLSVLLAGNNQSTAGQCHLAPWVAKRCRPVSYVSSVLVAHRCSSCMTPQAAVCIQASRTAPFLAVRCPSPEPQAVTAGASRAGHGAAAQNLSAQRRLLSTGSGRPRPCQIHALPSLPAPPLRQAPVAIYASPWTCLYICSSVMSSSHSRSVLAASASLLGISSARLGRPSAKTSRDRPP